MNEMDSPMTTLHPMNHDFSHTSVLRCFFQYSCQWHYYLLLNGPPSKHVPFTVDHAALSPLAATGAMQVLLIEAPGVVEYPG